MEVHHSKSMIRKMRSSTRTGYGSLLILKPLLSQGRRAPSHKTTVPNSVAFPYPNKPRTSDSRTSTSSLPSSSTSVVAYFS